MSAANQGESTEWAQGQRQLAAQLVANINTWKDLRGNTNRTATDIIGYGMPENSFMAACIEHNSIGELQLPMWTTADESDLNEWSISADVWRLSILGALIIKLDDAQNEIEDQLNRIGIP